MKLPSLNQRNSCTSVAKAGLDLFMNFKIITEDMIDMDFKTRSHVYTEHVTIIEDKFTAENGENADSFYTGAEAIEESFRNDRKSSSEYFRENQTSEEENEVNNNNDLSLAKLDTK